MNIPDEAMPVVEILRRDVPRPTAQIVMGGFGIDGAVPRFECGKCPMGLHPTATQPAPMAIRDFQDGPLKMLGSESISDFWEWWEGLMLGEARQVVDLIWPEGTQPAPTADSEATR